MLIIIIRILLIWWLLTVIFRFVERYLAERRNSGEVGGATAANQPDADLDSIDRFPGAIEEADFEEIENR